MKVPRRAELHYCEVKEDGRTGLSVGCPDCLPPPDILPEPQSPAGPTWRGGDLTHCDGDSSGDHGDLGGEIGRL